MEGSRGRKLAAGIGAGPQRDAGYCLVLPGLLSHLSLTTYTEGPLTSSLIKTVNRELAEKPV